MGLDIGLPEIWFADGNRGQIFREIPTVHMGIARRTLMIIPSFNMRQRYNFKERGDPLDNWKILDYDQHEHGIIYVELPAGSITPLCIDPIAPVRWASLGIDGSKIVDDLLAFKDAEISRKDTRITTLLKEIEFLQAWSLTKSEAFSEIRGQSP